ncbi:redoxin family protein, partial [Salmonella enterica subsp. enterica serovar Anatum]|nr:redoxin family protein [Salmonella enterica subsp. enterica serovar Anatum]
FRLESLETPGQYYEAEVLTQGKPVLLNVWATWCPTCRAEHQYHLVIGIAARNNEHIQVITSLTNALDDESVIERLAHTTSVDEVL